MSRRPNSRRGVVEAQLFGALQRAVSLWRAGEAELLVEQQAVIVERSAALTGLGGDPSVVAGQVWAREVNSDLESLIEPAELFGVL